MIAIRDSDLVLRLPGYWRPGEVSVFVRIWNDPQLQLSITVEDVNVVMIH